MLRHSLSLAGAACAMVVGSLRLDAQSAPLSVTRVVTIGCEDCTGSRHLGQVFDVAVNQQGDVLVADQEAPTLRVFSRDGKPLRQFGRQGSGPGEYQFPMRAAFGPRESVHVLDMRLRRITHTAADGAAPTAAPIGAFPSAVGASGESGELVVLSDDFRGTLSIMRWMPDDTPPAVVAKVDNPPSQDGALHMIGVAVSRDGEIAVALDPNQYRIVRYGPDGARVGEFSRDIARERRTAEEQAELDRRLKAAASRATAEMGRGRGPSPFPNGSGDLSLKPHFFFDGMRYDERGNLWVLTLRGTPSRAVIDVFGHDGAYRGAVEVPANVKVYALGTGYLVTAGERDDGTPVVELWRITFR